MNVSRLGSPPVGFSKTAVLESKLASFSSVELDCSQGTSAGVKCRKSNSIPSGVCRRENNSITSVLSLSTTRNTASIWPALGDIHTCSARRGPHAPCHLPSSHAKSDSVGFKCPVVVLRVGVAALAESTLGSEVVAGDSCIARRPAPAGCCAGTPRGSRQNRRKTPRASLKTLRVVVQSLSPFIESPGSLAACPSRCGSIFGEFFDRVHPVALSARLKAWENTRERARRKALTPLHPCTIMAVSAHA